ncbi:MAG: YIP1 family protein [Candidatus Aenigmarchaeota archaeon]|nr:YIP1 family protein [Candidatus Aenigmarchaeota archaeon]
MNARILLKISSILLTPSKFFASAKKEKGIGDAFKYYFSISLIPAIATTLLALILGLAMSSLYQGALGETAVAGSIINIVVFGFVWITGIVWRFIAAGMLHAFAKILGAKNYYSETYKAVVYSNTPHQITALLFPIMWIPAIGSMVWLLIWTICGFYALYLSIVGMSVLHNMSMGKAAGAVLLTACTGLAVGFFVFIAIAGFITGFIEATTNSGYV